VAASELTSFLPPTWRFLTSCKIVGAGSSTWFRRLGSSLLRKSEVIHSCYLSAKRPVWNVYTLVPSLLITRCYFCLFSTLSRSLLLCAGAAVPVAASLQQGIPALESMFQWRAVLAGTPGERSWLLMTATTLVTTKSLLLVVVFHTFQLLACWCLLST
jgi:hypothetical protein